MIAKKYRLKEREVKKVLQKGKPFFSSALVFNVLPNTLSMGRFAIVISSKSVPNNIIRNMYRRMFYEICKSYIDILSCDVVCVIKTKTLLTRQDFQKESLTREILSIFEKKL